MTYTLTKELKVLAARMPGSKVNITLDFSFDMYSTNEIRIGHNREQSEQIILIQPVCPADYSSVHPFRKHILKKWEQRGRLIIRTAFRQGD